MTGQKTASRVLRLAAVLLALAGCADAVYLVNQEAARSALPAEDLAALDAGNLASIRDRYEPIPAAQLPTEKLALLCDVLLKYQDLGRAQTCLDELGQQIAAHPDGRNKAIALALPGKTALLALSMGRPEQAAKLTADATKPGGRYVNALAEAHLGHAEAARAIADRLRLDFEPAPVYYAAAIYAALDDFASVRAVLEDPARRLLRDYGLSGHADVFGTKIGVAVFRLDPFDEFDFGLFGTVTLAPAANAYVEYLAALAYLRTGDLQEAGRRLDTLLSFPFIGAYRDIQWRALTDRAELARRAGELARAERLLRKAVEVVESVRSSIGAEAARITVTGDRVQPYRRLVDLLVQRGDQRDALAYAIRGQSRALVELLATQTRFGPSAAGTPDRLVAALDRAAGEVQLAAATAPDQAATRQVRVEGLRRELSENAPDVADLVTVEPPDLEKLQHRLGADEAALVFFAAEGRWMVFTVTTARVVAAELVQEDVIHAATALRQAMLADDDSWREPAAALYRSAIAPALREVTASALVIVPAGVLHYVPFAALGDGGTPLVDRYALRVVPNLQLLMRPGATHGTVHPLVVGDPLQGDPDYSLPGAEAEARQVAELLPHGTLLIGREATVPRFLELAGSHDLIHFAGHGKFSPARPLQSGLVFTSPAGKPAILTAAQIYEMRTTAVLAFLSACETGLGAVSNGDDVIGMQRGLFLAGVHTVVGSLWKVEDEATKALATAFYQAWTHGAKPARALRSAQLAVRERFPHPSQWSAFYVAEAGTE